MKTGVPAEKMHSLRFSRSCGCMLGLLRTSNGTYHHLRSTAGILRATAQLSHQHVAHMATIQEWPGLQAWRDQGINALRSWGANNKPSAATSPADAAAAEAIPLPESLVGVALLVLNTADPNMKAAITHRGFKAYCKGEITLHQEVDGPPSPSSSSPSPAPSPAAPAMAAATEAAAEAAVPLQQQQQQLPARPARPLKPQLVIPRHVPSPKASPLPLNAHMLHNLAHIELNAVDLAWDTVARYSHLRLPAAFYEDFARVADDESRHFSWCVQRLAELGHSYGDMVAHDLLWEGAAASAGDLGARLAIVPLSQEARGLDAGQRLVDRLVGAGDQTTAAIVQMIAAEERAHVAVGVVWFTRLCAALGVDAPSSFRAWLTTLAPDLLKGPFNHCARQEVGLQRDWYDVALWPPELLQQMVQPAVAAAARGKGLSVNSAAAAAAAAAGEQQERWQQQQQQQQGCHQPSEVQQQLPQQQQHAAAARMAVVGSQLMDQARAGAADAGDVAAQSSSSCAAGGGQLQSQLHPVPVPREGKLLEELRQRLWGMLQAEVAVCNS